MGEGAPKSKEFRETEDGVSYREGVGGEPGTFKVRDRIDYEYEIPGHLYKLPEERLPSDLRMKLERGKYKAFYKLFSEFSVLQGEKLLLPKNRREGFKTDEQINNKLNSISEGLDILGLNLADMEAIYKKVGLSLGMEFGEEVIARLKNFGL